MTTYDLGDPVALSINIRDAAGALANAGAVVLTVTLPDGTSATPLVTNAGTGVYTAVYTPTIVGRYVAAWVATGANANAYTTDFVVVSGAALLTRTHLEQYLHRTIAPKDADSADAAVEYATALVTQQIGFDPARTTAYDIDPSDILVVRSIALRIAVQFFTNPEDRAQYAGPEGLSYTASPQMLSRIMGEADRRTLTSVQIRYAPGFA